MVKGVSRQVIVVHAPDPKLFEQAIFILKADAVGQEGITEEALLKEADQLIRTSGKTEKRRLSGAVWAAAGALITGVIWLVSAVF